MRVGIVGSQSFFNYLKVVDFVKQRIDPEEITLIVSGGAVGADTLAQDFAKEYEIPILIYYPKWTKQGNAAGPVRNEKIVAMSDVLFAFWDGKSPGTGSTIKWAKKYRIEYLICDI